MKIGFIGCGNMGKAMMGGIISSNIVEAKEIIASDGFLPGLEKAKKDMGINITTDNREVAKSSEVIVLSVKPQYYESVIKEISPEINENTIIITIAPGQSLSKVRGFFGKDVKIVRTMPNTPALVKEGMTAVCPNELITKDELEYVCSILNGFGKCEVIEENLIDAVVGVSGSAPAYVFMFIEAMADAAVREGMPRNKAYNFAAQAVYGSAKMVLETGKHPGELKDMVCSPGGTTIEAVMTLEEKGMRSSVMEAIKVCTKKSREM